MKSLLTSTRLIQMRPGKETFIPSKTLMDAKGNFAVTKRSRKFQLRSKGMFTVHTNEMPPKKKTQKEFRDWKTRRAKWLCFVLQQQIYLFFIFISLSSWLFSFRMYVKIFHSLLVFIFATAAALNPDIGQTFQWTCFHINFVLHPRLAESF